MKKIILLLSCLLLLSFTGEKNKKNKREEMGLKGPVKLCIIDQYKQVKANSTLVKDSLTNKATYKFDEKGNMIESRQEQFPGKFERITYFTYDSNSDLILMSWNQISRGKVSKDTVTKFQQSWEYKLDTRGNVLEEKNYSANGRLFSHEINKYDYRNNLLETDRYDSLNTLVWKEFHTYDEKNNDMEGFTSIMGGSKYKKEYDGNGRVIVSYMCNTMGEMNDSTSYTYTKDGSIKEAIQYNQKRKINNHWVNYYDRKGELVKVLESHSPELPTTTSIYSNFDGSGNWLKEVTNFPGSKLNKTGNGSIITKIRTIEYY